MANPTVAQKSPYVLELEPGTYHWCACGESKNQPYCDGSHKGTEFSPVSFTVEETKKVALCGCKGSGAVQFCDGSHKNM